MIVSKLNKNEYTKITYDDHMMLIKATHTFYSPNADEQNRKECLNKIINLLAIYSEGENDIRDIEAELSKLVRI